MGGLETRGDIITQGLWKIWSYIIIDIRFGDADADTYKNKPMDKPLDLWEKQKKDKHGNHCHEQWFFSPFPLSVYGILGEEDTVVLMTLSQIMAEKIEEPI